jgi:hypothetical protein
MQAVSLSVHKRFAPSQAPRQVPAKVLAEYLKELALR